MFGMSLQVSGGELTPAQKQNVRILLLTLAAIGFALMGSVSMSKISFFEFPLPTFCAFKLFTGLDCPGCGLTRAIVFAMNGQFYQSYLLHLWGIPLAALLLLQIPYRVFLLLFDRRLPLFTLPSAIAQWKTHVVVLSLGVPWLLKTGVDVFFRFR